MKVTFVYKGFESLAIEYLSAVLKKAGHNTALVYDPALFSTFQLFNKKIQRTFTNDDLIIDKVINTSPDIVAFSAVYDDYEWLCTIAERIKKKNGQIRIIFGGIHPTCVPEEVIADDFIDYVCVGEGEEAFVELLEALEHKKDINKIKNIWSKVNGRVISNDVREFLQDLNTLPFPDKDLFRDIYKGFTDDYVIMTSRGCPFDCNFCHHNYLKSLYNQKGVYLRRRSVDNVIAELKLAKDKYKMEFVAFFDDIFIYDKEWLRSFSQRYRKEINIPCYCFVHPAYVDKETIYLLSYMNCVTANMGVQTASARIRNNVLKRLESNESIGKAIKLFQKSKIFLYIEIMVGLPGETKADLIDTAQFLNFFRPDAIICFWLAYFPKLGISQDAPCDGPGSIYKRNSYNKEYGRLSNFILYSNFLEARLFNLILKYKLYNLFAPLMSSFSLFFWLGLYLRVVEKMIFQGKGKGVHSSFKRNSRQQIFFFKKSLINNIFKG